MHEETRSPFDVESVLAGERGRLIRLCAHLCGPSAPAEDLAQETLLEAWQSRDRLRDESRYAQWLSGIAHNVCLRWKQRQVRRSEVRPGGVTLALEDVELHLADDTDLELELERVEIAAFLDRAMASLPPDTRTFLVQRYVDDLPVTEIAARYHTTEGAASVRLHRGKRALRRILTTELRAEAAALGLTSDAAEDWQLTRIWCPLCGGARLLAWRHDAARTFVVRCPHCGAETVDRSADYLGQVTGHWRTLLRSNREADQYYRDALASGTAPCACCRRPVPLVRSIPREISGLDRQVRGVHVRCPGCGCISLQPDIGLVQTSPHVQRFWRTHKRVRMVSMRDVEAAGRPAFLVRFESVGQADSIEVVSSCDTFQVLAVTVQGRLREASA